jgi:AAA domain, putative AbiEii toxin, Type IV TA system/AAA ATPase domain
MLTSLEIKNFKCFSELTIGPLAKVNLFVGAGNSGKTSVLEALGWLPRQTEQGRYALPGAFRDTSLGDPFQPAFQRWFFHELNPSKEISITAATNRDGSLCSLATLVSSEANKPLLMRGVHNLGNGLMLSWGPGDDRSMSKFPAICMVNTVRLLAAQLAKDYDRWTKRPENDDRFVEILKAVDPRLKSLRAMDPEANGQRMVYADVRLPERIPLPLLGDGFNRLVQVVGAIIGEGAEIVLVDEIENGLHWKALPQVWTGLKAAVSMGSAQIFATTHSYECIKAAIEVFRGEPRGELAVHRLERRKDGKIHCVTIEEDMLEQAVDSDWEIR